MSDRSPARNVFIELASEPGTIQAGLCAARNLTRAQFLDMLRVLFVPPNAFHVCEWGSTTPISPTSQVLRHGRYVVHPSIEGQEVSVSNERYFPRTMSLESTASTERFRDQVRHRDRRCVITHNRALDAPYDSWTGFQAAHIYPRSLSELFTVHGFANKLTYDISEDVNSPQNGILLRQDIHALWDSYEIAVNPNAGYRVHAFRPSTWEFHNRVMHVCCRQQNHPQRVVDLFLRWHFEQAVLCNMRGAGEPMWEFDFPPGSDMVGEILRGPLPAQRMEVELFERLHGYDGARSEEDSDKDEDDDRE
ncbi:HNH endonuclease-domain-containing protein [Paecilomyces variotii]|uniref:HNH endonuclease-domain-containing protein n=1 Tax=Byssochlamys spectabilis TaxID=264951 RepID=A0A443HJU2_BYSSP|nr:HNH endonuclease-domain-containing protein [Paecilomyces variotii]RWQ92055.1 HNH endonuclease-domain-containing protein [Paecilomyces variotii]